MENMIACAARSDELYVYLFSALNKDATLTIKQKDNPDTWNFRIYFHGKSNTSFDGISVSVPPDAMGNREGESVGTFETALLLNDKLTYDSDLDYDDICRFYSMKDVLDEILRLAAIQNNTNASVSVPFPVSVSPACISVS